MNIAYAQQIDDQIVFKNRSPLHPITHLATSDGKIRKTLQEALALWEKEKVFCRFSSSVNERETETDISKSLIIDLSRESVTSINYEGMKINTFLNNITKIVLLNKFTQFEKNKDTNLNLTKMCINFIAKKNISNLLLARNILPKELTKLIDYEEKKEFIKNSHVEYINILKSFNAKKPKESTKRLLVLVEQGFPIDDIKHIELKNKVMNKLSGNKCSIS